MVSAESLSVALRMAGFYSIAEIAGSQLGTASQGTKTSLSLIRISAKGIKWPRRSSDLLAALLVACDLPVSLPQAYASVPRLLDLADPQALEYGAKSP